MDISITNIFVLFIIFGIVSDSSTKTIGQTTAYKNFISERCRSNVPKTTYADKMREVNELEYNVLITGMMLPTKKELFCSDVFQLVLGSSLHNYTQALMECFPKEKYIPKFINESYTEYLNLLCASNGTNIDDLFGNEANICILNLDKANDENCETRLTLPLNSTYTKNQICSDLKSVEKCYNDDLQKHCSSQTNYISTVGKLFGTIEKPCNNIEDTSNKKTK